MKARVFLLCMVLMALLALPLAAQAQEAGMSVTCDNGASFDNGVEIIVRQMRSGFDYTATAVGLNGFDPVIAVLGESGDGLCNDDAASASEYGAELPTSGRVRASNLSSQVTFNHDDPSGFQDISLVVGGFNNQFGEFILVLEGMAVTSGDNGGDPFQVRLTPQMVASGVPLTVYMMTRGQSNVDPLISVVDIDGNVIEDADGVALQCDDAGTNLCLPGSEALDNYSVTIETGTLPGWQYDAYVSLDISGVEVSSDPDENLVSYLMSSYPGTEGQYLLAFHVGTTEVASTGGRTGK